MGLRAVSVLLALVLTAVLLAGCGDDRDPAIEYQDELTEVGDLVARALERLPTDGSVPIGPAQVRELSDELREAADRVEGLEPPDDARAPQRRFERGLKGVATAFDGLATALEAAKGDDARAELFVRFADDAAVDRAFDDLAAAQDAYDAAGYRVFREPALPPPGEESAAS